MEKLHYIEDKDQLVVETIYDAQPIVEQNTELRAQAPVTIGKKGQQLVLAMSIPLEHIEALKNEGYNLLSADPDESRRAMLYVQANQAKFLTTDKKMIAERRQSWR